MACSPILSSAIEKTVDDEQSSLFISPSTYDGVADIFNSDNKPNLSLMLRGTANINNLANISDISKITAPNASNILNDVSSPMLRSKTPASESVLPQYKVYHRRWFMLALFSLLAMCNNLVRWCKIFNVIIYSKLLHSESTRIPLNYILIVFNFYMCNAKI